MHALLAAFMNPPIDAHDAEAAFNAWYDEEHVPLRQAVPGFRSARRYRVAPNVDQWPKYLALYDLDSVDVLQSRAYLRLADERSKRESEMLARIPMMDRRVLELAVDAPEWTSAPPHQLVVCMTPPPGAEGDFVAWYRDEHIPMLLAVPGWRRARLFRQLDGRGPAFMALHELESTAVFDRPEHRAAISTPWRKRIRSSVIRYERNLFDLWQAPQAGQ
jgi:hypothetical protein